MENLPQIPPKEEFAPHKRQAIPPITPPVPTGKVDRVLDALSPPPHKQEIQATRALAEEMGAREIPLGDDPTRGPIARWQVGETVVAEGHAAFRGRRLEMRFSQELLRRRGQYPNGVPATPDDIRFGRIGARVLLQGEVLARVDYQPSPGTPPPQPAPSANRRRHALEKRPGNWRRRIAGGVAASIALAGSVLFGMSATHESPKAEHNVAAPEHKTPVKPELPPRETQQPTAILSFEDGNNTYEYQENDKGEITQITGTLGKGENPWTLTEGAYTLVIEDDDTPNQATEQQVTEANIYMSTFELRQDAKQLMSGTRQSWKVVMREEEAYLQAQA